MDRAAHPKRRKELVCLLDRDPLVGAIATPEATESEILVDRQLTDDAVSLRDVTDAETGDGLRRSADQLLRCRASPSHCAA